MRVLVTGADGFVGRWLTRHLIENGDDVYAASGVGGQTVDVPTRRTDVRDRQALTDVCNWARPDAIYHLAAVAFGPDASRATEDALDITVGGTINLLRAAAALPEPPVVLIPSSADVYGDPGDRKPLRETDPVAPVSPYGCTKAAQELVAKAHHQAGSLPVVIARAFNHIGPGQRDEFVVPSFARQLAAIVLDNAPPRMRVGNLASERDFTDVRDVVAAYRLLVVNRLAGEPYNVASGRAVRIGDILDGLIELADRSVAIDVDPLRMRRVDPPRVVGDPSKLQGATGWKPNIELSRTLEDVWSQAITREHRMPASPGTR